jgi:single-stranded-DNA-specific exonuclease
LEAGSKIYLAVDCDVDGYTSAALFWLYFTSLSDYDFSIEYHIPEGKEHGLRSLMPILGNEKIADLIVLPDSSSNDFTEHKFLKELGYDILVLDHHEASKYSDDAIVINN